jgi:hypothetical protein
MVKILRFGIFFLLVGLVLKATLFALSKTNKLFEQLGSLIGALLMLYLSTFIVKKYFRKY